MSESVRPPSVASVPAGTPDRHETHETLLADDGTRLFARTMPRRDVSNAVGAVDSVHAESSELGGGHGRDTPVEQVDRRAPGLRAIFSDGILCDGFIWKYLWNDLTEVCDVAHWHYPGHGRSGAPSDRTRVDIATLARDLKTVRNHLGDPPCVLLGHSMGTQVCLEEWHLFPQRVKGIVLLCGTYGKVTHSFRGMPILDKILPKLMAIADKQPDLVRAIWTRIPPEMAFRAAMLAGDVDPDHVRREDMLPYLTHLTHVDFTLFVHMLRAAGEHSAEAYLRSIDVPVLIVAGERDTFTPGSLSRFMAEEIPSAELLVVPAGSHVAPIEQPELVGARIKAFIERAATA